MYLCAKFKKKIRTSYPTIECWNKMLVQNAADLCFKLKPKKVTVDFEQAAINAFKTILNCDVKGCFCHYEQSIWRNIVDCGL